MCPSLYRDTAEPLAIPEPTTTTMPFAPAGTTSAALSWTGSNWIGTIVPAIAAFDNASLPQPLAQARTSIGGLFYAGQCIEYADFTLGTCSNTSHPDFLLSRCAFGVGDSCRPCPRLDGRAIAVCPGGARAWPAFPGVYTPSESAGTFAWCDRCLGWDHAAGSVRCAEGYRQYSPACRACDEGYFLQDDGTCSRCPANDGGVAALVKAMLLFGLAVLAVLLGIMLLAVVIAKAVGGTLTGGYARVFDLLL